MASLTSHSTKSYWILLIIVFTVSACNHKTRTLDEQIDYREIDDEFSTGRWVYQSKLEWDLTIFYDENESLTIQRPQIGWLGFSSDVTLQISTRKDTIKTVMLTNTQHSGKKFWFTGIDKKLFEIKLSEYFCSSEFSSSLYQLHLVFFTANEYRQTLDIYIKDNDGTLVCD